MSSLHDQQLARLHAKLVVPMAIGDILYTENAMAADIQYGLHEALSEMDPDAALLAICLAARHITMRFAPHIPVAVILEVEAEKLVIEYGSEWLNNIDDGPVDEDSLYDLLRFLPEDLECVADLLDSLKLLIQDSHEAAAQLCDILSIQARAHMEIADFMMSQIEQPSEIVMQTHSEGVQDNIIIFPGNPNA